MAFLKHCGGDATGPSGDSERRDRRDARTGRKPADSRAIHPAKCHRRDRAPPREAAPSHRPKRGLARMACGRKSRGQEDQVGTAAPGAMCFHPTMRRTGGKAAAPPRSETGMGPAPTASVHAGADSRRQPRIARDHQGKPAFPAGPRHRRRDRLPRGMVVMAQHDPRPAPGECPNRGKWVRQPPGVGEQPDGREFHAATRRSARHRPPPGQEPLVTHACGCDVRTIMHPPPATGAGS